MKKYFVFLFLLLLLPVFTSAISNETVYSYYSFNESSGDIESVPINNVLSPTGPLTYSLTGIIGTAINFTTDDSYAVNASSSGLPAGTGSSFSVSVWVKMNSWPNGDNIFNLGGYGGCPSLYTGCDNTGVFYIGSSGSFIKSGYTFSDWTTDFSITPIIDGEFHNIIITRNNSVLKLYVDGVLEDIDGSRSGDICSNGLESIVVNRHSCYDTIGNSGVVGVQDLLTLFNNTLSDGGVSEGSVAGGDIADLYNDGNGLAYPFEDVTPVASERLEQSSVLSQSGSVTVSGGSPVTILSGNIEIDQSGFVYGVASVPMVNATSSNVATCTINIDGSEFNNSQTSIDLVSGVDNHMTVLSFGTNLSADNYTFSLECERTSPLQYVVLGANLILHQLTTIGGVPLVYEFNNLSSVTISSGVLHSFNITTSANETTPDFTRALVVEWGANLVFNSSGGNISTHIEVAGINCTPMTSFGQPSASTPVGSSCLIRNLTNSTEFEIKLFANTSGSLENIKFHAKELIAHNREINVTSLAVPSPLVTTFILSPLFAPIANLSIEPNVGHVAPNLYATASISIMSNDGPTIAFAFVEVNGVNGSIISHDVGDNEPFMFLMQGIGENVTSEANITIFGACANGNCTLIGVDFISFLTDVDTILPVGFDVTLQNSYDDSFIDVFNVRNDEGDIFSTSSGTVRIATNESLFNVTVPGNNNTPIKFFENDTVEHNTSSSLALFARAFTAINAVNIDNVSVSSFFVSWTDGVTNGSDFTSIGAVYVPWFNSTYNITVFNATDSLGVDYANITISDIPVPSFLQNFTVNLTFSNSISLSFFETETTDPIFQNVTVDFSGPGPSFSNTSNTSFMEVSNLTAGTWTLEASSPLFESSTYFVTVTDRSSQDLDVFLLNSTLSGETTFTVKDRTDGNVIPGASFNMLQLINGSFVSIGQAITDAFGVTFWSLVQGSDYQFIISTTGFDTKVGNFTRTTSSYIVSLERDDLSNFNSYLNDFVYSILPLAGPLSNVSTNFSLTVSSPEGKIEYFSIEFADFNASVNVTGSPSGGVALLEIDLSNFTGTVVGLFTMKSVSFTAPLVVSRSWFITDTDFGSGNFTMTDFLEFYGPQDDPVDEKLGIMSRALLAVLMAVLVAMAGGAFFGVEFAVVGASVVFIISGFFGWIHWSVAIVIVSILLGAVFIRGGRI